MAANTSPRTERRAVLDSPLRDFETWLLAVDCRAPGCQRDRVYALADLVRFYGSTVTIGDVLRRFRCQECGKRVIAATLQTGLETGRIRALVLRP